MKILHVILGKADKNRANGVNQVIAGLAKYTAQHGAQVTVIGRAQTVEREGDVIARDGFSVTAYSNKNAAFRDALRQAVEEADLVHLHGTYSPLNVWVGRVCVSTGTPYIVTLHGGLSPARNSRRNRVQKWLFHMFLQKQHLENAALIQVLTEEESTEALAVIRPQALRVISNGIDLEDFPPLERCRKVKGDLRIGYIGRISREKNLHALCAAFSKVAAEVPARLLLAGPPSAEGDAIARRYAACRVEFVGPKFGNDKLTFLENIDLFVHPSRTDVFSIGAMEAMACGVPMVISRTSDTSYFAENRAFFMCEPTAFGIERALRKAIDRQHEWQVMARRGRHLIETRLNWNAVALEMVAAYRDILDR